MEKYNLTAVAHYIGNEKIGRTIIYRILREIKIVDESNRPMQKYIDRGDLSVGLPRYKYRGRQIYVTLADGLSGMIFINRVVEDYLKDHDIPRIKRKPKM